MQNKWIDELSKEQLVEFLTELVDTIDDYRSEILTISATMAGKLNYTETDYEASPSPFDEIVDKWRDVKPKPSEELTELIYKLYPDDITIETAARVLNVTEHDFRINWYSYEMQVCYQDLSKD
jgi:hypothetical protein